MRTMRVWLTVSIITIVCAGAIQTSYLRAQGRPAATGTELSQYDGLPGPYRPLEGWAKLPTGRVWGEPAAVDIDIDGKSLWVLERCAAARCEGSTLDPILKFDESGKLVKSFGGGMLVYPHGLHVDRDGNIWVTDASGNMDQPRGGGPAPVVAKPMGHQVLKFSPDGKLLMTLGKAGVAGDGPDTFNQPTDVATGPNGDIFVNVGHGARTPNKIMKFSRDGRFLKEFASTGAAIGQLNDPHGLVIDSRGNLVVIDRLNRRIQVFDSEGAPLRQINNLLRPSGLFLSKDDVLFVAEQESGVRIGPLQNGAATSYIRTINPAAGLIKVADSVAVDAAGNVFTGETERKLLMKYAKTK
jgi:sugar lactone lactonase YvrE